MRLPQWTQYVWSIVAALTIILAIIITKGPSLGIPSLLRKLVGPTYPPSVMARGRFAAVATDATVCSKIGTEILGRHGGSAVDAAIASLVCVGITNRHSAGIGGGHLMTVYGVPKGETKKRAVTFNARETAPAAANATMFRRNEEALLFGALSIAVPGEVSGYYAAWRMFGKLPWRELFTPSIEVLRRGNPVTGAFSRALIRKESDLKNDPNLSGVFLGKNGEVLQEGDLHFDPELRNTLERIADDPECFYSGSLGDDIMKDLEEYGGIITRKDLANYRTVVSDALNVTLRNGHFTVYSPRPPSSGAILLHILAILDGYRFNKDSIASEEARLLSYHRLVEAFKFAYAKRSCLGDTEFLDLEELLQNLTSLEYAEEIRGRISDETTRDVSYYEPSFEVTEDGGTTHLSVLAADGSAVAATSSINTYFASKVRGKRTGIIFNNAVDDFSVPKVHNNQDLPPSPSNYIEPGKRPMSSMTPTLVLDKNDKVVLTLGAAGGSRIISSTSWAFIHKLWFGQDRWDHIINEPRLHHQLVPDTVVCDPDMEEHIMEGLAAFGHNVTQREKYLSVLVGIYNECVGNENIGKECVYAVSDGRKGGMADSY